jgi:hypothetical protein
MVYYGSRVFFTFFFIHLTWVDLLFLLVIWAVFFLHFLNLLFNPCCFLILYFDFKFYFSYVLVSTC